MSRRHILPLSLIIALAFTYTGVELSLWKALQHPIFLLNFFLNSLEVGTLIYFTHRLYVRKSYTFNAAVWRSLGMFYSIELLRYFLFDYEAEDYVELYSIVLPFGTLLLLALNYFYRLTYPFIEGKSELDEGEEKAHFWIETSGGQVQFQAQDIVYAQLRAHYLELITPKGRHKCFISLKKLEELLPQKEAFFRLNKQSLCHFKAVRAYKSLKDGRLEIQLDVGAKPLVSKNKASAFKKWIAKAPA